MKYIHVHDIDKTNDIPHTYPPKSLNETEQNYKKYLYQIYIDVKSKISFENSDDQQYHQ